MRFLKLNILNVLILFVGCFSFSCKNNSFIKRKYLRGNYLSFTNKALEPKVNHQVNVKIEVQSSFVDKDAKGIIVERVKFNENAEELCKIDSTKLFEYEPKQISKHKIIKRSFFAKVLNPNPFSSPLFDFSYWWDDDPLAGKIRVLYLVAIGIIIIGTSVLLLLGKYSSINPYLFPFFTLILFLIVIILALIANVLNIIRWKRYKK